jgi:geranylgeranyl diphosphate synthase, type I
MTGLGPDLDQLDDLRALYPQVRDHVARLVPDWPEARTALGQILDRPLTPLALLPLASAGAVGGDPALAVPVAAAWCVVNVSIRLFDDLQDQDRPRGYWAELGVPRASNLAAGLLALSYRVLGANTWPERRHRAVTQLWSDELIRLAAGQDADLRGDARTLDDYWRMIAEKNARAYAMACGCGALAATDEVDAVAACHGYGYQLGIGLQLLDDLEGLWQPDGAGDLAAGRLTLPVLYGLEVEHPRRAELEAVVGGGRLAAEVDRVRDILDAIGTRRFLMWAALRQRDRAFDALALLPPSAGKIALHAYGAMFFAPLEMSGPDPG